MDHRATIAVTKLRLGLFTGVLFVIVYAFVQLGNKSGTSWSLALAVFGAASIVFLVSAIIRIIYFVYEEW